MQKRLFISAAASKTGIVILACILLSVASRPAYAIIDGWTALKIAEGIKKAYDFVMAVDSVVIGGQPDLATLIIQAQAAIIDEMRNIRNDDVRAQGEGVIWRFVELSTNSNMDWSQSNNETFYVDSLVVLSHLKLILTDRDLPSAYSLAQLYNLLVATRAIAMKKAGDFGQAAFDQLFSEAQDVNYHLVGAREVALDHCVQLLLRPICGGNTVGSSRMWQHFSNYWFRVPANPFCSCNVWENRCKPTGASEGYCIADFTYLIPLEKDKIQQRFDADPVIQVIRAGLEGLVNIGHNRVNLFLFGDATIIRI